MGYDPGKIRSRIAMLLYGADKPMKPFESAEFVRIAQLGRIQR